MKKRMTKGESIKVLSISEMEIIKSALEGDIIRQKKFLEELREQGGSDIRFEEWFYDSQILLKKVTFKLMDMKAKKPKEYEFSPINWDED